MNWRKFSVACLVIGVAAFLVSILAVFHWFATTPNVSLNSIVPMHVKVSVCIPIFFGMFAMGGLFIATFKLQEDC